MYLEVSFENLLEELLVVLLFAVAFYLCQFLNINLFVKYITMTGFVFAFTSFGFKLAIIILKLLIKILKAIKNLV